MREIKFRVWNTKTNKMIINVKEMGVFALQSIYSIDEFLVIPTDEKYPLMQYTGLKDKNGVEIYEGDIVEFIIRILGDRYEKSVCKVSFIDGSYMITKDKELRLWNMNCEVIGNIYENKDLLES